MPDSEASRLESMLEPYEKARTFPHHLIGVDLKLRDAVDAAIRALTKDGDLETLRDLLNWLPEDNDPLLLSFLKSYISDFHEVVVRLLPGFVDIERQQQFADQAISLANENILDWEDVLIYLEPSTISSKLEDYIYNDLQSELWNHQSIEDNLSNLGCYSYDTEVIIDNYELEVRDRSDGDNDKYVWISGDLTVSVECHYDEDGAGFSNSVPGWFEASIEGGIFQIEGAGVNTVDFFSE
jgi:hypothetical protein